MSNKVLILCLAVIAVYLPSTRCSDVNEQRLQEILQLIRQPVTGGPEDDRIRDAFLEWVMYHLNAVMGTDYQIGSKTGLFDTDSPAPTRRKRTNLWWLYYKYYKKFFRRDPKIQCPEPLDPSDIYDLSADPTDYPAENISEALFTSAQDPDGIFFTLVDLASTPEDPPQVPEDPNYSNAPEACPAIPMELFSYTNQDPAINSTCWLLQGFQFKDRVEFQACTTDRCQNCESKKTRQGHRPTTETVNKCIPNYETIQVVSYCQALPMNESIIIDRIILPSSCSCRQVECDLVY